MITIHWYYIILDSSDWPTEAENGTFVIVFRMTCASACRDSCSVCGELFPHRVPRAEDRLRMRRPIFCVRRPFSACGGMSLHAEIHVPHAETGVPRADTCFPRAEEHLHMWRFVFRVRRTDRLRMRRPVFRVRRPFSACGGTFPHAETGVPRAETCFRVRKKVSACEDSCSTCGGPSPHTEIGVPRAEDRLRIRRSVFCVRRPVFSVRRPFYIYFYDKFQF